MQWNMSYKAQVDSYPQTGIFPYYEYKSFMSLKFTTLSRNFCHNKWLQVLLFRKLIVSYSKEIPHLLWNLNIPYLHVKCLPLDNVVSQINPFLTLTPHSFKNLVNIILQHTKIYIVVNFFSSLSIIMYYMFTKIRNLMLSDFKTMMYGSCLSTTQSTALLQKQLEK